MPDNETVEYSQHNTKKSNNNSLSDDYEIGDTSQLSAEDWEVVE